MDKSIRLLTGGFRVRVPAGRQWMKSSMAEQRFVKPLVESSNLSSSAMFVMSEFDDEETVINQYSLQTKWCFGRMAYMRRGEIPEIVVQFHGAPPGNVE